MVRVLGSSFEVWFLNFSRAHCQGHVQGMQIEKMLTSQNTLTLHIAHIFLL